MKRALSISCLWICLLVLSSSVIMGQDNHLDITPTPQSLVQKNGHFTLNSKTSFAIGKTQRADLKKVAAYFQSKILYSTGYNLNIKNSGSSNTISLQIDKSLKIGNEGYQLTVTPKKVIVKAKTPQGVFYGMQSVMQLLPPQIESETIIDNVAWEIPCVEIKDEPAYGYRGMMLDVCRHFHDVEFVKKQLDIMAMFKMNYFHWHLTDDHLWTIEIKKYPRLAEVGSVRRNADGSIHRGFYTQEQIKEVVAYAAERYITVIPEVELPGHALAALTAYPEYSCTGGPFELRNKWGVEDNVYCAGNDKTFEFLQDILEEVIIFGDGARGAPSGAAGTILEPQLLNQRGFGFVQGKGECIGELSKRLGAAHHICIQRTATALTAVGGIIRHGRQVGALAQQHISQAVEHRKFGAIRSLDGRTKLDQ